MASSDSRKQLSCIVLTVTKEASHEPKTRDDSTEWFTELNREATQTSSKINWEPSSRINWESSSKMHWKSSSKTHWESSFRIELRATREATPPNKNHGCFNLFYLRFTLFCTQLSILACYEHQFVKRAAMEVEMFFRGEVFCNRPGCPRRQHVALKTQQSKQWFAKPIHPVCPNCSKTEHTRFHTTVDH